MPVISKARVKLIRSLKLVKYRTENRLFIAEGEKIISELLRLAPERIHSLYLTENSLNRVKGLLQGGAEYQVAGTNEMKKISMQKTPQEILALVFQDQPVWNAGDIRDSLSMVLDRVQDPGNLGTIIRTAHWFGIRYLICSRECADLYHPRTIQSSMGSFLHVQVHYRELPELLAEFRETEGFDICGTVLKGENIYRTSFTGRGMIILGNESRGISPELLPYVSKRIMIPSFAGPESCDSLNVAAAAAVVCSEIRRRETLSPRAHSK